MCDSFTRNVVKILLPHSCHNLISFVKWRKTTLVSTTQANDRKSPSAAHVTFNPSGECAVLNLAVSGWNENYEEQKHYA